MPERIKVWRVQDAKGNGPYTAWADNNVVEGLAAAHNGDSERPGPFHDFGWRVYDYLPCYGTRYGFLLREDALKWFDGWWDKLAAQGYALVEVETDEILAFGTAQVAFRLSGVRA